MIDWPLITTGLSATTLIAVLRLIFVAGKLVDRLEQLERRVKTIEERHEYIDRRRSNRRIVEDNQ